MNTGMEYDLSREKSRFTALAVITLALAIVILMTMIRPQIRMLASIQHDLKNVDAQAQFLVQGHANKQDRLREERNTHRQLQHDLALLHKRFNSFTSMPSFLADIDQQSGGRIDFKVALLEAREYLQARAGEDRTFPEQLGMADTIATDEKAESRLRQLAAIVKLVEQVQNLGVSHIDHIQPLLPLSYPQRQDDESLTREFPVQIRFVCAYGEMIRFLDSLQRSDRFFTLRRLQCEKLKGDGSDRIRVTAVCGAGLVQGRPWNVPARPGTDPGDTTPVPETLTESIQTPENHRLRSPEEETQ
ncbi:MAG: hypothetical protein VCG02_17545 [Verrucomicrobiota bacterium]